MKTSQAALAISKYKLFLTFLELVKFNPKLSEMLDQQLSDPERITYASCKDLARDYQFAWREIKEKYFLQWTKKPHELLDFNPMSNK